MRLKNTALLLVPLASTVAAVVLSSVEQQQLQLLQLRRQQQQQVVLGSPGKGVGHFSEWSRATKREFLLDWQAGKEAEWTIVQGNEAGDLDSMTAALTWAYHLDHATANTSHPIKAIALLQTPTHALDLRPENKLALHLSRMTPGHEDLLTLDELPEDPETLGPKLRGIVLVDHAQPQRKWQGARVLSIFDHHVDKGTAPDAEPRIFEQTASCTTIVARQMLDERARLAAEGGKGEEEPYHMTEGLLHLILSAIAIDSGGLRHDTTTTPADVEVAGRILAESKWANAKNNQKGDKKKDKKNKKKEKKRLERVMKELDSRLRAAKKDLGHLGLRDLLRRDWKGDLVDTPSPRTPTVSLGFASVPYSMDEQILKTDFQELFDWFAIEAAWTAEVGVDISIVLNNYKVQVDDDDGGGGSDGVDGDGKKKKKKQKKRKRVRELTLVVRDDVRINQTQATSLFRTVKEALENNKELPLVPWHRAAELAPRQMVWTHESDANRKVIRPIVEEAVRNWDDTWR